MRTSTTMRVTRQTPLLYTRRVVGTSRRMQGGKARQTDFPIYAGHLTTDVHQPLSARQRERRGRGRGPAGHSNERLPRRIPGALRRHAPRLPRGAHRRAVTGSVSDAGLGGGARRPGTTCPTTHAVCCAAGPNTARRAAGTTCPTAHAARRAAGTTCPTAHAARRAAGADTATARAAAGIVTPAALSRNPPAQSSSQRQPPGGGERRSPSRASTRPARRGAAGST